MFAKALANDMPPRRPKPTPRCRKPRLMPLLPRLGLYLAVGSCVRSLGHDGRCCAYWEG